MSTHEHHDHHGAHAHHHHHHHGNTETIGLAFFLNFALSMVEIVGGLWIGSFSIIAGAIHDFGDAISLGLAWYLERLANRKKNTQFNFGYRRFSLLSALIAGVIILSGSVIVCFNVVKDFGTHAKPDSKWMMIFAVLGIAVNALSAWRMSRGKSKNEKILTWHLVEDLMSWIAVLLSSVVIFWTDVSWLDPVLAILLSLYVAYNVFKHLKSTAFLFLQARPDDFNEARFVEQVLKIDGIFKVTNIAIWSLDGVHNILSCRIIFSKNFNVSELEEINKNIRHIASDQGHFEITIEPHYAPDCHCVSNEA